MSRRLNASGFTLVEIMIVVAIIALLAAIALPSFLRARKRSLATAVKNDLRLVDSALDQYALEYARSDGTVPFDAITLYLKRSTRLANNSGNDLLGNPITPLEVGKVPKVNPATLASFSDVCDSVFWSPYMP